MIKILAIAVLTTITVNAIQPVEFVNVKQFLGRWYQQSRKVLDFEPPVCACAQQTLTFNRSGYVDVFNSCNIFGAKGPRAELRGRAISQDPTTNNRYTVDFGNPEKPLSQYWIIALDPNYEWAVISDPTEESLFILSKSPSLEQYKYSQALQAAARQVKLDGLKPTSHNGCRYP